MKDKLKPQNSDCCEDVDVEGLPQYFANEGKSNKRSGE
jgi:hypothetical protein